MAQRVWQGVRKAGRIGGVVGWLIVVAGIALLVVPTLLGYDRYVIVSGSMHPTVDRGGVVFAQSVKVSELVVGDVITYQPPAAAGINHLVTHRISSIDRGEDGGRVYRTRGDANPSDDPWTFALVGERQNVMRFSVPFVGHALSTLANPHVRMALVGVPAALIALGALVELVVSLVPRRGAHAA